MQPPDQREAGAIGEGERLVPVAMEESPGVLLVFGGDPHDLNDPGIAQDLAHAQGRAMACSRADQRYGFIKDEVAGNGPAFPFFQASLDRRMVRVIRPGIGVPG